MKLTTTTSEQISKNSRVDFYLATEIYKLDKAAKVANAPRLRASDYRNVSVKKMEQGSAKAYIKEQFKFEFTFLKRGFQKVLALAHIH